MRRIAFTLALCGLFASAGTGVAWSDDEDGWRVRFSPADDLYPRYVADPRRSNFSIGRLSFSETEIPAAGDTRFGLRVGGRYGVLRLHRKGDADYGFQIDVEGGFLAQFDLDNHTDNIGWDGIYGLQLAWARPGGVALRAGVFHDSSHVGDEYAESTGRTRINYTRQEFLAGASWRFLPLWRTYVEGAWAFDLRNEELMEKWRAQTGVEFESPATLWGGRAAVYVAADASFFQEDDWSANVTIQTGLLFHVQELARYYRFGIEFYDGRSHIGEFFQNEERYVSLGVWFDL